MIWSRGRFSLSRSSHLLSILFFLISLQIHRSAEQWTNSEISASFYGDSHLWLSLQDASSATDLTVNFRTHQRDAIIFLAAGETDYCLVELRNGRLRVRVNLGSGESVLQSPRGLRLDDYVWHTAQLSRRNAQATLTVDRQYVSHLIIPGVFYQLNIIYGVYLGGLGQFRDLFLGHFVQFRGCLKNVKFNTIEANRVRNWDILRTAFLNQSNPADCVLQHIRWDCDDEFSAKNHDPISFISQDNFVTFPTLPIRQNGSVQLDVKTIATEAVLLYNGGSPSQPDFLALDIYQGRVRLQVEKGNGPVLLESEQKISDGHWHNISCQLTTAHAALSVDGKTVTFSPRSSMKRYLDLDGSLFVGGVDETRRQRLRQQGLYDRSFLGCIKDLRINDVDMGFEKMLVSNGIEPQCVWDYPCSRQPCIATAQCYQIGLDSFRCDCQEAKCEKDQEDLIDWTQVVRIRNFTVKEASHHIINQENIRVIWNYQGESIRDGQIVFQVQRPPRYGRLQVNLTPRISENTFTYLDVLSDRVWYVHDGSERPVDQFELTINIPTTMGNLSRSLALSVEIVPENDPPKIIFPNGPQIEIVPGTARTLSADIMRAVDPDSNAGALMFTLLVPLKVSQIRSTQNDGQSIMLSSPSNTASLSNTLTWQQSLLVKQFTQADIDAGLVEIYFNGSLTDQDQAVFSISDGQNSGKEKGTMSIIPLKLNIQPVANKSLNVPNNSSSLITQNTLSYATNAIHQNLTILYTIISHPHFGRLEHLYNNSQWLPCQQFTQDDVNTLAVRYVHLHDWPSRDAFKVRLSVLPVSGQPVPLPAKDHLHTVHIRFLENQLKTVHMDPLVFHTPHVIISSMSLLHEQEPMPLSAEEIVYTLTTVPRHGALQRGGGRLKLHGQFTQADVNAGLIVYSLVTSQNLDLPTRDYFLVNVSAARLRQGIAQRRLLLKYDPVRSAWVLRDQIALVKEGGNVAISDEVINLQYGGINQSCSFGMASYPVHGILQTRDKQNVSEFFTQDVRERGIFYTHDGTESEHDAMDVIASCNGRQQKLTFPILINISLINNHRPAIIRMGPIFLIQNSTRLLTNDDMAVTDRDGNSPYSSLQIAHRGLDNADLYHISDRTTPIFQCIQNDIAQGHVLIKHRGPLQAVSTVYISDGELFTTEQLDIQAEPLQLQAKDVHMAPLHPLTSLQEFNILDFNFQTNADQQWNPLVITISKGPKFGTASVRNHSSVVYRRKDTMAEMVIIDSFLVQFALNGFTTQTNVSLVPARSISLAQSEPILVKENGAVVITTAVLNATHPIWPSSKIVYTLQNAPSFGSLGLGPAATAESATQEDINLGKLKYINRLDSITYRDSFVLKVEAPFATEALSATVSVYIVPEVLRLTYQKPFKVVEGGHARLKLSSLLKGIPNAESLPLRLHMKDKPGHGKAFVDKDGDLIYTHDGSESTTDVFTIFVNVDRLGISTTEEIRLDIVPINDHPPQIVIKNPLDVWLGQAGTLTLDNVDVVDEDSDANASSVQYYVNSSDANVLVDNQKVPVFTMAQLLQNRVRFAPASGLNPNHINLYATDGKLVSEVNSLPVRVLDVKLNVVRNESIEVGRNASLIITADELDISAKKISIADNQELGVVPFKAHDLIFNITAEPKLGFIGYFQNQDGTGTLVKTKSFSQKDLQEGRIGYMQSVPITNNQMVDSFHFDASLKNPQERKLRDLTFFINIKSSDSSIRSYPLLVPFGRSVLVKRLHLDATRFLPRGEWKKIRFALVTAPKLGAFFVDTTQLKTGGSFSQTDVNKHRLSYQHHGYESQVSMEEVTLRLTIPDRKPMTVTLNVTILESDTHLKVHVKETDVVSGENVTISTEVLKTNMDKNPNKVVRYRLFKEVTGGVFRVRGSVTKEFTQRDVMQNVVEFCHDGVDDAKTIPVQLEVMPIDEAAMSELVQFNIHVHRFFFKLYHHSNMTLTQGNFTIPVNNTFISVASNVNNTRIVYHIIRQPEHGRLRFVDNHHADSLTKFTQQDVEKQRILYEHRDLDQSEDYFTLDIFLTNRQERVSLRNITIHLTVVPLLKLETPVVPVGHSIPIGLHLLDAGALKLRATPYEPHFLVTRPPALGTLLWASPDIITVTNFTQTDLVEKKIVYKAPPDIDRGGQPDTTSVQDSFAFLLTSAPDIQPVHVLFPIRIRVLHQQLTKIVTNDHVFIALVVTAIISVAVIFFIGLCWWMRRQREKRKRSVSQHAHLSPLFHPKGRTGDSPDEALVEAPATVPSCKVIPLRKPGKNFRSPETELHPLEAFREDLYGSVNGNGCVSRSETTPVLSKNQYWV
ncbi:chondroitin sulfate proteoglycan 4-like [Paramacrobiotus metropolitanus]|uniref:chondroitin sulfate proteoglycan 4-like n=1 Tax=Paramacrobiotus metropolitanus TaxID=2943436 RepID=UPI002445F77F|nr:chondroitin sulfate proteoglycan 4-like [Paramacrobiotus metropolitanus]